MQRFYFTYGTEGQPFYGGWTIVEAENTTAAAMAFKAYHPNKSRGILNCAGFYTEEQFKAMPMSREGNFGKFCHEIITLSRSIPNN